MNKIILQTFESWRKENCKQLADNLFDFKGDVFDSYDLRYVYMREVKNCSIPNMTLEQAIAKAKPNLDKITDVDKHLDDIR
jgi:tRNA A37 threonylcarbamoyladenosine dehydratase